MIDRFCAQNRYFRKSSCVFCINATYNIKFRKREIFNSNIIFQRINIRGVRIEQNKKEKKIEQHNSLL